MLLSKADIETTTAEPGLGSDTDQTGLSKQEIIDKGLQSETGGTGDFPVPKSSEDVAYYPGSKDESTIDRSKSSLSDPE